MNRKIKIALPTDDGLTIRQQSICAKGFFVATIKSGIIVHQELRSNLLSEILTSEDGLFYNLVDCDLVIVRGIGTRDCEYLKTNNKEIVRTHEPMITKALKNYLIRFCNTAEVK